MDDRTPEDYTNYLASLRSILVQTELSWLNEMKKLEETHNIDKSENLIPPIVELENEEDNLDEKSTARSPDESRIPSPQQDSMLDSVGPPRILQFRSENLTNDSEMLEFNKENFESSDKNFILFLNDFNLIKIGGQKCEFCGDITRPWPSLDEQKTLRPEEVLKLSLKSIRFITNFYQYKLYCCSDYRDFAEALLEFENAKNKPKQEFPVGNNIQLISNNTSSNIKKVKKVVKEKAAERYLEQQKERILKEKISLSRQESNQGTKQFDKDKHTQTNVKVEKESHEKRVDLKEESFISNLSITKQLGSINYQLSNLRHMKEGWTIRPVSPIGIVDLNDNSDDENNLIPNSPSDLKKRERPLMIKHYKNGSISLILFPDGTGNVFYPNGSVAISISLALRGHHIFTAFHNDDSNKLLGHFDPYGNVNCNYLNGNIHLQANSLGGMELDINGSKKKRWFWSSSNESCAPPYQPSIFALNNQIGVKILSQNKMFISYVSDGQIFRFRVGSNLQHLRGASNRQDPVDNYIKKSRTRINFLLRNINSNAYKLESIKLPKLIKKTETQNSPKPLNIIHKKDELTSSIVFSLTQISEKVPKHKSNANKKLSSTTTETKSILTK